MSSGATSSGARCLEMRKRLGSVGWRTLIWPNASTMPSWARMRLASESSSRMAARLSAMGFLLRVSFRSWRRQVLERQVLERQVLETLSAGVLFYTNRLDLSGEKRMQKWEARDGGCAW